MKRKNRFNPSFLGVIIGELKYPYLVIIFIAFFVWFAFMIFWQDQNKYHISATISEIEAFKLQRQTEKFPFIVVCLLAANIFRSLRGKVSKKSETKIVKNSIYEILPISDKDYVFGLFINALILEFVFFGIPYLIMIFYSPIHPAMIGVRGVIVSLILLTHILIAALYVSAYNNCISKSINRILYILGWSILGILVTSNLSSSYKVVQWISQMKVSLYSSSIFNFLGNIYVVIILGIITIACFYYFNYIYILKGVEKHGWKVERK